MMLKPLKVMLVVPENNTTMEREMLEFLPTGSSTHIVKVPRGKGLLNADTLPAYKESTIEVCAASRKESIDIVAYGCTAAGFIMGPEGDLEMAQRISQVVERPVITTAGSMVKALQELKAKHISLLTPYSDLVNEQLKKFLLSGDIVVKHFDSFYAPDVIALGKIQSHEVAEKAKNLFAEDIDAFFIACSQLPTVNILDSLAKQLGKPVLSSIQVTAKYINNYFH
jgi:maleate cis-trans isomerase